MHLAYIWIVSHFSAKNYRNWWKFDEVLTKTNLLSFFGTRRIFNDNLFALYHSDSLMQVIHDLIHSSVFVGIRAQFGLDSTVMTHYKTI